MFPRTILVSSAFTALTVVGSEPSRAQVCPNLDYARATHSIGSEPWCATSGDVDGDGALDILVGRSPLFTTGELLLLRNSGQGQFPSAISLAGTNSPRALALGDLDLDGDLDLVVSDRGVLGSSSYTQDGVAVLLNDGLGHFSAQPLTAFAPGVDDPSGLALGDLDGDGDLDVAVAIRTHSTGPFSSDSCVLVYLNDGHAQLAGALAYPTGTRPGSLLLADFDADGALDYASVDQGSSSVSVVFGHGDGTFDTSATSLPAGLYPGGLCSGDFDADGDVDLAVGWKYGLRILQNQGNGSFTAGPVQLVSYYNKALASGDFNLDGKLDLLATFATSGSVVFLAGDGHGAFSAYRSYAAGTQAWALTTGDWNRDSILDVATADFNAAQLQILSSECGTWTYCSAKINSLGCLPQIAFSGIPSVSAGSGFVLSASNIRNRQTSLLFYGTHGRTALPFFGGTLCVATPLRRTPGQNSGGSASGADCTGTLGFDFNAWIASGADPALLPGTRVDAQYLSRDPGFPAPDNVGLTDAVEFTIEP